MTGYRNETIRQVEDEIIAYRAKQLVHPRMTYTEYKAKRRERLKVYQAFLLGVAVLATVAVTVKSCVG